MKSQYICSRCELAVYRWGEKGWKHAGGWHARSCGKPPRIVERVVWEREMAEFVSGTFEMLRDRSIVGREKAE